MYIIRHCNYSMLSGLESGYMAILGKGEENKGGRINNARLGPVFLLVQLGGKPSSVV